MLWLVKLRISRTSKSPIRLQQFSRLALGYREHQEIHHGVYDPHSGTRANPCRQGIYPHKQRLTKESIPTIGVIHLSATNVAVNPHQSAPWGFISRYLSSDRFPLLPIRVCTLSAIARRTWTSLYIRILLRGTINQNITGKGLTPPMCV